MGTTNEKTIVIPVIRTVGDALLNNKIAIPAGAYYASLAVKSNVTGTTTIIGPFRHFTNPDMTAISDAPLSMYDANDASLTRTTVTLPAGPAGRFETLCMAPLFGSQNTPIVIPHGLNMEFDIGGASVGEVCEVDLILTRAQ